MRHINNLFERYPVLVSCKETICTATQRLIRCFENGNKLLLCGNGGSAADAEHWSAELLKGFCSPRSLNKDDAAGLTPELADKLQGGLAAIPLNGFMSLSSAFANDVDGDYIYAQLVWSLGAAGDTLVAISTSGNSLNIVAALQAARAKGMTTIGLTGESGGRFRAEDLCDICIQVPQKVTHLVQELHLPVYHAICLELEDHFFPTSAAE